MSQRRADHFWNYEPQPGDIFACYGTDLISRLISLETSLVSMITGPQRLRWSPSHVAIAAHSTANENQIAWFESTTMAETPCLSSGRVTSGCQVHTIPSRVRDYCLSGGSVSVFRLTPIDRLSNDEAWTLSSLLMNSVGDPGRRGTRAKSYDAIEAMISGTRAAKYLIAPFQRADMNDWFCSKWIAAVLQRVCRMNRENPALYNPGLLLRRLVRQGTYGFYTRFDRGSIA